VGNWTPLHFAVTQGHLRAVQKLIDLGCSVNLGDSDQKTVLHYACKAGNMEIVKLLLKSKDINIHPKDIRGVFFEKIENR
jgi:ankyrin repeat protein